jgi:iron complex outermembrane receptor protein
MKKKILLTPIALVASIMMSGTYAQQTSILEPVVIKATKVDEPLLGTPHSVTVLTGEQVENNQIRTVEDISKFTPNLKLDNGYGAGTRGFLSIRGVGNTPGSMDPSASIYVDDIPYHDFMTYSQPLFDVKQIEVLKGPQGTLYGGFAQAGVIDIRSNLPGKEVKKSASIDLYTPQNARTTVSLSGPVNDVLSLGLSVLDERGESHIRNVTLDKNSDRQQNAVRLQGVLRPDASTEAVLTVLNHRQRNDGGSDYMPVNRATYNTYAGVNTGKFEIANNIEGYQNLDTNAQSLRLKKRTSDTEYTVVAANRETKSNSLVDFNYTPNNIGLYASSSQDKITNQYLESRARLLPKNSNSLDLTVGASYMKQGYDVHNIASSGLFGIGTYDLIKANGDNKSIFANASLPVNDRGLKLIGGLRQEWANRTGQNDPSFFSGSLKPTDVAKTSIDSTQLTWKAGVSNVLKNGADLYAHIASGWRPSAVNYYASTASAPRTVGKEKSITYETGYRQATDSQYFAAAVFLTKVKDYQETITGTNYGEGYLANVAKVDIPGFEIEAKQALTKAINFFGGLGYTRARYGSYPEFSNLEGKALGNRPDWNIHVGTEYKEGRMTYAATVVGTDSFNSAYTYSGATTKVNGHLVGNLRATYQEKNYSVSTFINNVANKEYFLNAGYYNYGTYPASEPRGQVGLPRTIGVKLKVDF